MRPRLVLSALGCVAALILAPPSHAESSRRLVVLEPHARGRDTLRVLGRGEAARFVQLADGVHALTAVGGDEPQRYLVTFDEAPNENGPARASFAARVSARRALARRFESEIAHRGVGRFDATGHELPRVLRSFDRLVAGSVVLAPAHFEATLRAIPGVRAVFPDLEVHADASDNIRQVRADRVQQELGGTGLGVRIGIIDTGIDYRHAALGGGFGPAWRVMGGWDFVNGDADPLDDHGHGTHVAGIAAGNGGGIVGMAPLARLYAYKVLDANGSGQMSDVIAALERCADPDQDPDTDDHLDAVNLSLGAFTSEDEDPATEAVDALDALGTVVAVAAANFGIPFAVASPGIARGAVTVGSVASNDSLSEFSSRGPTMGLRIKPDLVAPGESIESALLGGGTTGMSGTSMATPHVTGAAALLRQIHPEWTHEEMRSALVATAFDLRRPAAQQGSGRLDVYAAATATLFVSPTSLAFGRIRTGERDWARAETLHVHARSDAATDVALSLEATLPSWLEATLSAQSLHLAPGVTSDVILRLRVVAEHAPLPDLPFIVEGALRVQSGAQVCRVPFSVHEALTLRLATAHGGAATGLLIGGGRALRSLAFGERWLLQPGVYDILAFGDFFFRPHEPFLGLTDVSIASDTVVTVANSTGTGDVTWALRDAHGSAREPQAMALRLLHESGAGLGYLGLTDASTLTLPVMKPGYRLQWWAYDETGNDRLDIPGVERAPLTSHTVSNDPTQLRRLVEHVHVASDSLLFLEFQLYSDGDGWFGFEGWDPFATPIAHSFDIVRWTAPVPERDHLRFGHTTWSVDPQRARARTSDPFNGMSPVWDQRHGDTLVVAPRFTLGDPLARFTGRELPFGSGAMFPDAWFQLSGEELSVSPKSYVQIFRDGAGSIPAAAPATFEVWRGGQQLDQGTISTEELQTHGRWARTIPGGGPVDLRLRSAGWSVAGRPSTTTVTLHDLFQACPSPEWFSIVAGGGPAERIAFGQHRDPHVELRFAYITDDTPLTIEVRDDRGGPWIPLLVERAGGAIRAAIPPVYGEVAMRVRIGAVPSYYTPMEVEIEPAFLGEVSPAANAAILQASADASGAHVEWRVPAPGEALVVERLEPNADWRERGEIVVDPDGIARFDDPAVTPGARYGYRLGSFAEVYLQIPNASSGLALAIRSNPSTDGLVASVTLDRAAPVTIRVHDLQGRLVASRTWTSLGPGVHALPVLARGQVKAGLYFVRLERAGETRDRRVTILP